MAQTIFIPGLKGNVTVNIAVTMDGVILRSGSGNFVNDYYAKWLLEDQKATKELGIRAFINFPNASKDDYYKNDPYFQIVEGKFTEINLGSENITPAYSETLLQGDPQHPGSGQSKFRYLGGKAVWLTSPNNPRIHVVKIAIVLGSPDQKVETWDTQEKDKEWKIGVEVEVGGDKANKAGAWDRITDVVKWVSDKAEKLTPTVKPSGEASGGGTTRSKGGSFTKGDMTQTREWTLVIVQPEPKKVPKPMVFREGFMHAVYFDTNKTDIMTIGNYRPPKSNTDQLNDLRKFIEEQVARYGKDKITGIEVVGHASRLGDSGPNFELADSRANSVANFIKRYLKGKNIPDENILPRGEPYDAGNDKDNSWKDRVVWVTINAVR